MTNIKERAAKLAEEYAYNEHNEGDEPTLRTLRSIKAFKLGYLSGHADAAETITKLREALSIPEIYNVAIQTEFTFEERYKLGKPAFTYPAREALEQTKDA